jgi:predicted acylesterase/phospholipase RssA/CRP-like cAMP-binding protein
MLPQAKTASCVSPNLEEKCMFHTRYDTITDFQATLAANPLFGALDHAEQGAFERAHRRVRLVAGETLFRQGDPGDALYMILSGRLAVRMAGADGAETVVAELAAPACVGELALLTEQERGATVSALEDAELARFAREDFRRLAKGRPELIAALTRSVLPRLRHAQLADVLASLFGELDAPALRDLQAALAWRHLAAGEVLFRQGALGNALYIVINGRLSITTANDHDGATMVGEVRRGETVGEVGLLTGSPRSATATAARDTDVVRLSQASFERLYAQYPRVMIQLSRLIARRTRQLVGSDRPAAGRSTTFAVLPISPSAQLEEFALRLAAALDAHGPARHLDSAQIDRVFDLSGGAQIADDAPMNVALVGWLSQQEAEHRSVVYQAGLSWSAWTQRCLRQADRIVLLGVASDAPAVGALEQQLWRSGVRARVELVLVQPDDCVQPSGTMAWLARRPVQAHHHLRMGNDQDWRRLARRLTGRATGLAFSGGGARGYAHVGVIRALEEADVEIDLIAGTSMGALAAGLLALGVAAPRMADLAGTFSTRRKLFDLTLPLVSFLASARVTAILRMLCGDVQIEDLWRPFLCVSSNLTRSEPLVHTTGPLWRALRASMAIPGMFAPVLHEGEVLVDGGVLNNLPLDLVRERCEDGVVIGSNVTPLTEQPHSYQFDAAVSGWEVLLNIVNPFRRRIVAPSLFDTLMRTIEVNLAQRLKAPAFRQLADVLIESRVNGFSMLDFPAYAQIIDIGYRTAQLHIPAIQAALRARTARTRGVSILSS